MRWPLVRRSTHDRIVQAYSDRLDSAVKAIIKEYARAIKDGRTKVYAFMVEANYNVLAHPRPDVAIRAVFQEAEKAFMPEPHPLTQEVFDATAVSAG